jgi:hypothetical protein
VAVEEAERVEEARRWRPSRWRRHFSAGARTSGGGTARPPTRQIYEGTTLTARAQELSGDDEMRLGFAAMFGLVILK